MGEGQARVGDGDADGLIAEVEPGQRVAALQQRRQFLDGDDRHDLPVL
jgi:hypothetical protein